MQLRQKYEEISDMGGEVLALAPDSPETMAPLLKILKIPYPILADPQQSMYKAYGLFVNNNLSGGDFVVDPQGFLSYVYQGVTPDDKPPMEELISAVAVASQGGADE